MTAFDQAWEVTKMPIYHGTSTKHLPGIMREGLKPTATIPDVHARQLIEEFGYDEDDDEFWNQLWLYGVRDRLKYPTDYAISSAEGYGRQFYDDQYFDEDNLPVILEMPGGTWEEEAIDGWEDDPIGYSGFGDDEWVKTQNTIPPERIKVFAQANPDMTVGEFIEMMQNRSKEMGFDDDF